MESQAISDVDVVHHDDLTVIPHIGRRTEERLNDAGIVTYAHLAEATPEEIFAALKGLPVITLDLIREYNWIDQAKRLAEANRTRDDLHPAHSPDEAAGQNESELHRSEAFMLRLLVDAERKVLHTYISSVQSQKSDDWAGWDPEREQRFIARSANVKLGETMHVAPSTEEFHLGRSAERPHSAEAAADSRVERTVFLRGSLSVIDWRILEGERQVKHLVLVNQPFDIQMDVDASRVSVPPDELLDCEVSLFARAVASGERIAIGRSRTAFDIDYDKTGAGAASPEAIHTVQARGVISTPGEYRIEAIVVLKPAGRAEDSRNQAAGLLEGIFVRAYEGS